MAASGIKCEDALSISGRSMRSVIKMPARFRDMEEEGSQSRRASVDSTTNPKKRRRPQQISTGKKHKDTPSPLSSPRVQTYPPAAFPSRPPNETNAEHLAYKQEKKKAELQQFTDEDDGFGESWSDIEPVLPDDPVNPHFVTVVLTARAKRALSKDNDLSFATFYREQREEMATIALPGSIPRQTLTSSLTSTWRHLASTIFDEDAALLTDSIAGIDAKFAVETRNPKQERTPADSLSPTKDAFNNTAHAKHRTEPHSSIVKSENGLPVPSRRETKLTDRQYRRLHAALPSPREVSNNGGYTPDEIDVYRGGEERAVPVWKQCRDSWYEEEEEEWALDVSDDEDDEKVEERK